MVEGVVGVGRFNPSIVAPNLCPRILFPIFTRTFYVWAVSTVYIYTYGINFFQDSFFFFYLIANVKHKRAIFQIEIRIIGIIIPWGFFFFFSFLFSFFNCKRLERLRGERDRNLIVAIISRKDTYCIFLVFFHFLSFLFQNIFQLQ